MTHRDLCRAAATWLASETGRNLHAACWELAFDGGVADAVGISVPDVAADVVLRSREYASARAVSEAKRQRRMRSAARVPLFAGLTPGPGLTDARIAARVRRHGAPVVAVAECKVSRADWLADAAEAKHRRYERAASECWLVLTPAVAGVERAAVAARLAADGLPDTWGVLVVDAGRVRFSMPAKPLREPEPWEVVGWAGRICASYTQRGLLRASPMARELA